MFFNTATFINVAEEIMRTLLFTGITYCTIMRMGFDLKTKKILHLKRIFFIVPSFIYVLQKNVWSSCQTLLLRIDFYLTGLL